jgi:hypothetical protein
MQDPFKVVKDIRVCWEATGGDDGGSERWVDLLAIEEPILEAGPLPAEMRVQVRQVLRALRHVLRACLVPHHHAFTRHFISHPYPPANCISTVHTRLQLTPAAVSLGAGSEPGGGGARCQQRRSGALSAGAQATGLPAA